MTPGQRLRKAIAEEKPLQVVGTINAYVAIMAEKMGYRALYLSGAGMSNCSLGLPDVGLTTLNDVIEEAQRITNVVKLPLIVDIDTGWGQPLMIQRAIRKLIQVGAAAVHIEDQIPEKKCGHLKGKTVVSSEEMCERISSAAKARSDESFMIIARCDAFETEGMDGVIERSKKYIQAGADILFPDALESLQQFIDLKKATGTIVLANITEFGKTPLYTREELKKANIDIALYPLTITRTMNLAAKSSLQELREKGTQKEMLSKMQTRKELYEFLKYDETDCEQNTED